MSRFLPPTRPWLALGSALLALASGSAAFAAGSQSSDAAAASSAPADAPAAETEFSRAIARGYKVLADDPDAALAEFRKAIPLDRTNYEGYYTCALAAWSKDDFDTAIPYAKKALGYLPANATDADKVRDEMTKVIKKVSSHEGDMAFGPEADFEPALKRGQALLDKGDPAGALVEFKKAIQAGSEEYQGHFYAAIAYYRLGDLKAALEDGQIAAFLIHNFDKDDTDEGRKVRDVVALIEKKSVFAQKRAEADAAYGDGLMAKAAQAYADAFAADPTASDVGLKAATLFADRFDRLLDAAIIWQTIVHQGGEGAQTATAELARRDQALKALLAQALDRRQEWRASGHPDEPLRYAQAFPENQELQLLLAELFAAAGDEAQTIEHLKRASQLGLGYTEFSHTAAFQKLLVRPNSRVAQFVSDAFGPDKLAAELRRARVWQNHERWTVPGLELQLMPIPAGKFVMGSPATEAPRGETEDPRTTVTISRPFWLGRTEVTQAQWREVMGTTVQAQHDKEVARDASAQYPIPGIGGNFPMYYVSWDEAVAFCRKLTEREAAAGRVPDGYVYALPTEAQWEYACRAGTTTPIYTGGLTIRGQCNAPELDPIAWYGGNSGASGDDAIDATQLNLPERQYGFPRVGHHPVGLKQPNAWGLCDMLGSVMEWCRDWQGAYPGGAVTDPTGPASGEKRVLRGASFTSPARYLRSAARNSQKPDSRFFNLGFRVALMPAR